MKRRYKFAGGMLILLSVAIVALMLTLSHDKACPTSPSASGQTGAMTAIRTYCYGATDVLQTVAIDVPQPADNEILVKIHAASVNPLDWHYMRGSPYIMRLDAGIGAPEDTSVGVDFAGTVAAIGKNVSRFKPGDEVFGGKSGAFAEYIAIAEDRAVTAKPANVSFAEAASVPIAGVTALEALRDKGQLKAGQKVLINGASGGVGTFAVQIAKALGAEVTGVCSTRNIEMVQNIGADHVIDYTKEDYTSAGKRYDLIIDTVSNHSLLANREVLTPNGRFVIVGGGKGDWIGPLLQPIKGLLLNPFVEQEFAVLFAGLEQADLAYLAELMNEGKIKPVIDRHYDLADVPEAVAYSEAGRARGKIIIDVN